MKWNIDDVPMFVAVVDQMGITAAADALGRPKSTVSTAISRLEHGLGIRLLDRNSRNLRVTEEGQTFYRQALLIMEQVREADATVAGLSAEPSGRLAVALPPAFTQEIVAPQLPQFLAKFPNVELEILVTSHGTEMLRDQVDAAVVVGALDDSEIVSRTLIAGPLVWVASPAYLARASIGDQLDEIRAHILICEKRYGIAKMPVHVDGKPQTLDLARGVAHVNDPLVVRETLLNGAGLSLLPRHFCREQIADGSLVELFPHMTIDVSASTLTLVFPSRRLMSPKLRAFIDFLTDICAAHSARS